MTAGTRVLRGHPAQGDRAAPPGRADLHAASTNADHLQRPAGDATPAGTPEGRGTNGSLLDTGGDDQRARVVSPWRSIMTAHLTVAPAPGPLEEFTDEFDPLFATYAQRRGSIWVTSAK